MILPWGVSAIEDCVNINYTEIFNKYLRLLYQLIEKAAHSDANESEFLRARLFEDMLPFNVQVKIVTNFALRGACPVSGNKYEELTADIENFNGLKSHIAATIEHINQLAQNTIEQPEFIVKDTAGLKEVFMKATDYLSSFALPNFFFHLSMAYAIAKSCGISVTKGDFDGIHHYPKGFSWES